MTFAGQFAKRKATHGPLSHAGSGDGREISVPHETLAAPGPYTFHDVLGLDRTDTGWLCEIDGRPVLVMPSQIALGTRMPGEGQRGAVTIAAHAVATIRQAIQPRPRKL